MKVIIQYNCIPHYRARLFELLTECKEMEFTIVADSDPDTPFLKTISGDGERLIRHIQAINKIIHIPGLPDLYWQPRAISIFLKQRPCVLIVLGSPYSFTAWSLVLLGKLLNTPVLLWGHGLLGEESGPKWWVRKLLYNLSSGQLLYGDYARKLLVDRGFDPKILHVVYNSLDYNAQLQVIEKLKTEDNLSFKSELGITDDQRLVVFTGRIQPVKRLDMLVESVGILYQQGFVVHVAIIGEGTEKSNLEAIADKYHITSYIHFLGASYDEFYIGKVFSAADLCVIPSGAGLTVMHSMVFGTPVLLHDRLDMHFPEWEAVEEGKTGFFYKYGDTTDMVRKMEHALFPEPKKKEMEGACKRVISDRYNPHRQVDRFIYAVKQAILMKSH